MKPILEVDQIYCAYEGTEPVVKDLSFHVRPGDITTLLGPSGCGKTTTLRAIAGFEPLLNGSIKLDSVTLSDHSQTVLPEKRSIGMVFQDYALFPHLTVLQNVCFGLDKLAKSDREQVARHYLEVVRLASFADRYPDELSGGQQQRVALARALAPKPKLLLMDEPFSNLDGDLRRKLAHDVREILISEGITSILVTHDQEEAFSISDHIAVIHNGTLEQYDTPFNIYHEPSNRFVATFIGLGHFLRGTALDPSQISTEAGVIKGNRAYQWEPGTPVDVLLRPDDIVPDADSQLTALIIAKKFTGAATLYTMRLSTGSVVESLFSSHLDYEVGDFVNIRVDPDHLIAFSAAGE